MENIGAVKELCKVTGKLETRIDHLEKITNAQRDRNDGKSPRSSSRSSAFYFLISSMNPSLILI